MDFVRFIRVTAGAAALALASAPIDAPGQTGSLDEAARAALSSHAEAAQLFHLEERCPTLSAQERADYVRHLSTAAGFLETMARDAYREAVANEQAIGSRLIPDRFRDCADPGVADAIRAGRAKAWTANVLISQIPSSYRLASPAVALAPIETRDPHQLATGAAVGFGMAYTLWHLEERCRVLPVAQRNDYAATIEQTRPLVESAAPDLFRRAVTSAQTRGPLLIPDVFPDCAQAEVRTAIEQGARDAQNALGMARQLPAGYRMTLVDERLD
jgi:hypothetical protein